MKAKILLFMILCLSSLCVMGFTDDPPQKKGKVQGTITRQSTRKTEPKKQQTTTVNNSNRKAEEAAAKKKAEAEVAAKKRAAEKKKEEQALQEKLRKEQEEHACQEQQRQEQSKPNARIAHKPSVSSPSGYVNGHEWVDLGLSVKWATCNVGASSPTDYGGYYAWGETRTKITYSWDTYFYSVNGSSSNFNKYAMNKNVTLELFDDVANVNWGGSWRMPTRAEQDELREKCTWTWTTQNGVKGYKVSSNRNGNTIFLPAAGYRNNSGLGYAGSGGNYWSSSLNTDYAGSAAYGLGFGSVIVDRHCYYRCNGQSVRAVCPG